MTAYTAVIVEKKLEKRGSEWVVLSSDGKKLLGKHKTRAAALLQIAAVEASKAEREKEKEKKMKSYFGGDLNEDDPQL